MGKVTPKGPLDVLHVWGVVAASVIVFMILSGLPYAFENLWRC
jgi:hypothetical protein